MTPAANEGVIAVMQPYFYPYAGYFGLLAAAGTFVIFDDVQFNRRGRVHRCEVPGPGGAIEWLTLPLAYQPRDILIKDLAFATGARATLDARLLRLPWLASSAGPMATQIKAQLFEPLDSPVAFLERGLKLVSRLLALPAQIVRSSSFALDPGLRGQARIIALVQALGGHTYVNASGGRTLYDASAFDRSGIRLQFLRPYGGPFRYMLPALTTYDPLDLRADVLGSATLTGDQVRCDERAEAQACDQGVPSAETSEPE